jgi:hypothetical protein
MPVVRDHSTFVSFGSVAVGIHTIRVHVGLYNYLS